MAFTTRSFCWTGIMSSDPEAAAAFYASTLGWDISSHEFPNGDTTTMAVAGGVPRAHIRAAEAGQPSHWMPYLRVDIVDAATTQAEAHGGKVLVPPTDIAPGRFSVVQSPSGAAFALFHEADESTSNDAPAGAGGVHWTELHSTDVDGDLAWLQASFGYATGKMPIPTGTYHLLKSGDVDMGGAMTSQMKHVPSMWLTWIQVDDVDDTCAKVTSNGGTILSPAMEMEGIGRMAIASDPTGAVFGVITPPN